MHWPTPTLQAAIRAKPRPRPGRGLINRARAAALISDYGSIATVPMDGWRKARLRGFLTGFSRVVSRNSPLSDESDLSSPQRVRSESKMDNLSPWNSNWAWSVPLIVMTVLIHVMGLGLFNVKMVQVLTAVRNHRHFMHAFALGIAITTIWATLLHAIEAGIWATAYRLLGALPDTRSAMLYSLSAITTYGHSELFLTEHWRLMGALEALNGIILIGLTTALLYGLINGFGLWRIEHCPGRRGPDQEMGRTTRRKLSSRCRSGTLREDASCREFNAARQKNNSGARWNCRSRAAFTPRNPRHVP